MFCPICGTDERQRTQFCRVCGADLRAVRNGMEGPDPITAVAVSAREEICRAIAAKIMELESGDDLKEVAESVLPEVNKLLRSPEEQRLRRIRGGVTLAGLGVAIALGFVIVALASADATFLAIATSGLIPFFIGLSLVLNGLYFSMPRKQVAKRDITKSVDPIELETSGTARRELTTAQPLPMPRSVTEHTTHTLGQS